MREILPAEEQRRRAVASLHGGDPGRGGFHGVARTPYIQTGDEPQARRVLHCLMRRTVLAQPYGIVRIDKDHALLHERCHAQCIAGVVGERKERRDVRNVRAVQAQAVRDRRHAELAHAVVNVIAAARFTIGFEPYKKVRLEAASPASRRSLGQRGASASIAFAKLCA